MLFSSQSLKIPLHPLDKGSQLPKLTDNKFLNLLMGQGPNLKQILLHLNSILYDHLLNIVRLLALRQGRSPNNRRWLHILLHVLHLLPTHKHILYLASSSSLSSISTTPSCSMLALLQYSASSLNSRISFLRAIFSYTIFSRLAYNSSMYCRMLLTSSVRKRCYSVSLDRSMVDWFNWVEREVFAWRCAWSY